MADDQFGKRIILLNKEKIRLSNNATFKWIFKKNCSNKCDLSLEMPRSGISRHGGKIAW